MIVTIGVGEFVDGLIHSAEHHAGRSVVEAVPGKGEGVGLGGGREGSDDDFLGLTENSLLSLVDELQSS